MDGKSRGRFRDLAYLVPSVGAVLLPKCPLCFLAFASFLDLLGIDAAAYSRSLLPVVFALLSIPIVLLGFYRTGSARVRTVVLMVVGGSFYIFGRVEQWPISLQAASGGVYCLGALWKSREKTCCCVNTREIVHPSKTA